MGRITRGPPCWTRPHGGMTSSQVFVRCRMGRRVSLPVVLSPLDQRPRRRPRAKGGVFAFAPTDVVQCPLASAGCTSGTRDGWSSGMDLFTRPLLPALVGLLVCVTPWCRWSRLHSPDEVLSPFVGGDVEVRLPKQLLGSGWHLLHYGSDEGQVIRSPVEVLDHCCFSDLGNVISHGLKPLEVRPKSRIPSTPNGFEVPRLRRLVGEGLEVSDKTPTEVAPIIDAVPR
jgi:hypothetical protein